MKCLTASFPCPPRPFLSLRDQKPLRDKDPQIWTPQALRHDEVTARHSAMVAAPVSELSIFLSSAKPRESGVVSQALHYQVVGESGGPMSIG
jgi:hypothetical protein